MSQSHSWTIVGDNPIADALRSAAATVDIERPITIMTEPGTAENGAFGIGPAVLATDIEHVVPYYGAYEAVEEVRNAIVSGAAGRLYGIYASMRIPRGSSADLVAFNAALPIVGVVLDLLPGNVTRAWAQRASLVAENDAWFITLRCDDEVIATIEAMAVIDGTPSREMLIEVTASDKVLRAEPTDQAVVVERIGSAPTTHPWWEDMPERFLKLVARRADDAPNNAGATLRAVWTAIQQSATTGEPANV
jgi:hypothetical protein